MTWFAELFGFPESRKGIDRHISLDGEYMRSTANGRTFTCGHLSTPSLGDLTTLAEKAAPAVAGTPTVREVVADARALHADAASAGALFQVASQFNLLEMVSPSVTPDRGITRYEGDPTQGPACAMACAPGTLQRNWFAQTTKGQIDTLAAVGAAIGNIPDDKRAARKQKGRWWTMRNGYALLTGEEPAALPPTHEALQVGLHRDTEVTEPNAGHLVTQLYCSALPIAYSPGVDASQVERLARMVLHSAYEATLAAGTVNAARPDQSNTVYLTLLGGGVFGNPAAWILDAIERAIEIYAHVELDIAIVSYGNSNPALARLLT